MQTENEQQPNGEKTNLKRTKRIGRTIKRIRRQHTSHKRNKENRRNKQTLHHNTEDQRNTERIYN